MRIDIKDNNKVGLNSITNGKTFKYSDHYYIATDEREPRTNYRLCVDLSSGSLCRFTFDALVTPISLLVSLDPETEKPKDKETPFDEEAKTNE